jgi:hypothetical protein
VINFRTRFIEMTPTDRILHARHNFDVKDLREIGRHHGLEIRAVRRTQP